MRSTLHASPARSLSRLGAATPEKEARAAEAERDIIETSRDAQLEAQQRDHVTQ